uniref:Uncharacterized protein n=1 Tax=Mesoaciditoga lauensis TaxID=1495039 RepID=A0A7V3VSW1_9BACT
MTDSFFSYKKNNKSEKDLGKMIDEISVEIAHLITTNIMNELDLSSLKTAKNVGQKSFKELLEEEISKFDSIEEVRYLGEYLVDLWKKTHEI